MTASCSPLSEGPIVAKIDSKWLEIAADFGIENVTTAAKVADKVGLPFAQAMCLLQMESSGRNIYGSDKAGMLSGFGQVNRDNFAAFEYMVVEKLHPSNGVGPCQITYRAFFPQARKQGLDLSVVGDNMTFGFKLLLGHYKSKKTWEAAFTAYNGKASYGKTAARRLREWEKRLV